MRRPRNFESVNELFNPRFPTHVYLVDAVGNRHDLYPTGGRANGIRYEIIPGGLRRCGGGGRQGPSAT